MARAVHEQYLQEMRLQAPHAKPTPSTAPWEELMETFRAASRAQAEHIDVKLANIQCCRVAMEGGADFAFSDEEIERLARLEHRRWCVNRWLDGWTYGPQKKVELLQHDQLKPYEDLIESQKNLDREPVRNLPRLLALSNAAIQRERHIVVDRTRGSELIAAEALSLEAEACKRVGTIPVIDIKLANPGDLALARTLQQRDLAVRLLLGQPVAVLAQSFPRENLADLVDALDAARDVFLETKQQPAADTAEPAADHRASDAA
jgi:hypothetical protein